MRRGKRILLICLASLVVVIGLLAAGGAIYVNSVENRVKRVDAFDEVPDAARPAEGAEAKGAMNFLVLGSDTRDPQNTRRLPQRHDHPDAPGQEPVRAQTRVDPPRHLDARPEVRDGKHGDTDAKINAAYAWGGVPLTVQTDRGVHRGPDRPRGDGRLLRLQGDRRRARRGDDRRRGELHRRPTRSTPTASGTSTRARSSWTAPRPSTTPASATRSRTATSPASATSSR